MKPGTIKLLTSALLIASPLLLAGCDGGGKEEPEDVATEKPVAEDNEGDDGNTGNEPPKPEDDNTGNEPPKPEDDNGLNASTFAFSKTAYSVSEESSSVTVGVSRTGSSGAASVAYSVIGGSATADMDYVLSDGVLSWKDGESGLKPITVEILLDEENEADETVELELSKPLGGTLGELDAATLTIQEPSKVGCIDLETTSIATSTTLSSPCYNVNTNISVSNAAVLTINPGVVLKFAAGRSLEVEADGQLIAEGTAEQPITFTAALQTPGYWDGIEINSVAPSSLKHVVVEYGGDTNSYNPANIGLSSDGRAAIENATLRFSASYGLALDAGEVLTAFANNLVTQNEGAPVRIGIDSVWLLDTASKYTGNIDTAGISQDYIQVDDSSITRDQTWNALDVEYRFRGAGPTLSAELTIQPGAKLVFPKGALFQVVSAGTLKAIGTESQPIIFSGREQSPGYWDGIQFYGSNNLNEMSHTIVEYGGGDSNSNANVGIFGMNGRLSIANSILRHSESYGFSFDGGSAITMDKVTSTQNSVAGRVSVNDIGQLDSGSDYTGNTFDRVNVTDGTIARAQSVVDIGVPYLFLRTSTVEVSATLTIMPGVEFQFSSGGGLIIDRTGALVAQGSEESPIVFTGREKVKGYWKGIEFRTSASQANIIDHAVVEYAGALSGLANGLVGFWSTSHGVVSNTVLRSSLSHGISVDDETTGMFEGNTFEDIGGENIFMAE